MIYFCATHAATSRWLRRSATRRTTASASAPPAAPVPAATAASDEQSYPLQLPHNPVCHPLCAHACIYMHMHACMLNNVSCCVCVPCDLLSCESSPAPLCVYMYVRVLWCDDVPVLSYIWSILIYNLIGVLVFRLFVVSFCSCSSFFQYQGYIHSFIHTYIYYITDGLCCIKTQPPTLPPPTGATHPTHLPSFVIRTCYNDWLLLVM